MNNWQKENENKIKTLEADVLSAVTNYSDNAQDVLELLDFCNKFSNYSFANDVLILKQRRGAQAVASFTTFKKMGYHVLKGEKAIKILLPCVYKYVKDANGKLISLKRFKGKVSEDDIETRIFFKIGNVFEVTQTDMPKEEYPKLYPNAHQDFPSTLDEALSDKVFTQLKQIAEEKNIILKPISSNNEAELNGALGCFIPSKNEIILSNKNTTTEMVDVFIHELAHGYLHNMKGKFADLPYELKELQAEMTAYMVSKYVGIDTTEKTTNYISGWTNNGKKFFDLNSKQRKDILSGVTKIANHFEDVLSKVLEENNQVKEA